MLYIHHYLHEGLEVVVSIHLLHIVSQHFITEDVVILVIEKVACNADAVCHTRRIATYSVGYDSRSLDTSRLDGLEDIHRTFCLQTFQLRVDTQERTTPHNPVTLREGERERKFQTSSKYRGITLIWALLGQKKVSL